MKRCLDREKKDKLLMTLATETHTQPFARSIDALYASLGSLSPTKARAWERFQKIGLPTKKNEAFNYVPLSQLYALPYTPSEGNALSQEKIAPFIYPECKGSVIVFVDGSFSKELSNVTSLPSSIAVLAMSAAEKRSYASFLQRRMQQRLQEEKDPFALLTLALNKEGCFVFIPPKTQVSSQIQCLFVTTRDHVMSLPRLQVAVGAHSDVSWVSTHAHLGADEGFFHSGTIDFSLDEASKVEHTLFMDLPKKAWGFTAVRATAKKEAKLSCRNLSTGSKSVRQDYHFSLVGEGADVSVSGLSWLEENYQSHAHVLVDHEEPHCTSHQFFKGVLSGGAHSSFTGKIVVRQKAQKTQAYQLNNNLLLTEGTIAYSKPGLEILADDVKASHGATVSQLEEEQLFYLKTRGLSEETAKTLLVFGFCNDILNEVSCDSLRQSAIIAIEQYLQRQSK